jgi:hypothetical protein
MIAAAAVPTAVIVAEAAAVLAAAKSEGSVGRFAVADLRELVRIVVRVGTALPLCGIVEGTVLEDTGQTQAQQQLDGRLLGVEYYNKKHSDPLTVLLPGRSVGNLMAIEKVH